MSDETVKVLVFSDDVETRKAVIQAIGVKPGKNTPRVECLEAATKAGVIDALAENEIVALVVDGESPKEGGLSIVHELRGTHDEVPPVIVLTARPQDNWLASWAGAAATVGEPFDPIELAEKLAALLPAVK